MFVRDAADVEATTVGAAEGAEKAVLIGEDEGAPNFALREFTLAAGGSIPKHTNAIEHVQYVLAGSYTVGAGEGDMASERQVTPGDALLIPAGEVHWYRNEGDTPVRFLCTVPHGDDEIQMLND